jgi:hypothetical protein
MVLNKKCRTDEYRLFLLRWIAGICESRLCVEDNISPVAFFFINQFFLGVRYGRLLGNYIILEIRFVFISQFIFCIKLQKNLIYML